MPVFSSVSRESRIPGPPNLSVVYWLPKFKRDPIGTFRAFRREYGDVVRLPNPLYPTVQLTHPDHIGHVLQTNSRNYHKSQFNRLLRPLLGDGLVTSNGEVWHRHRRMVQPGFAHQRLEGYAAAITAAGERLIERWREPAHHGQPVDVAAEMGRLGVEVIADVLFGDTADDIAEQVVHDVFFVQEHVARRFLGTLPIVNALPTAHNRVRREALARMDAVLYRLIAAHRDHPRPGTLLSMLLEARDPETGLGMDERQLRDEVMTLFMAGHETTANAMTWTWHLLSQHPEAEASVQAEADAVAGSPRPPHFPGVDHTRRVIQEAMRLYPPVWALSREALEDDCVGGYPLPAGSMAFISPAVIHRHPDYWDDPDRFDPDRFRPERAAGRPDHTYLPFGGGPRVCVGTQFAWFEMLLAIPAIAARYRLQPASAAPVVPEPLNALRPRGGLWMTPVER